MRNIKKLFILIPLIAMISACSFKINFGGDSGDDSGDTEEPIDTGDGQELVKQSLTYSCKDLANRSMYYVSTLPSTGEAKIVVIPVWLSDSNSYYSNTTSAKNIYKENLRKAFFGESNETTWRSVKSYYEELSTNQVTITGEVTDFYETTYSTSSLNDPHYSNTIVSSAFTWWKNNNSSTYRNYDSDQDGYIDGFCLIYFAPNKTNYSTSDPRHNYDALWAYVNWLQESNPAILNPIVNAYMWASYDFIEPASSTAKVEGHTIIHETGHLFGLEDYYDYSYSDAHYRYAGGFSMQDENVGSHDPWSLMTLGWAKPYVPTTSCSITIGSFQTTKDLIVLSPDFHNSPFDEFLILELFSNDGLNQKDCQTKFKGYPKGPSVTGIRLWHVDSRLCYKVSTNNYSVADKSWEINSTRRYSLANTNTANVDGVDTERLSKISSFRDFHLLNLVRAGNTNGSRNVEYFAYNDVFTKTTATFDVANYNGYFINGKLNNGKSLGFTFKVSDLNIISKQATIEITKL